MKDRFRQLTVLAAIMLISGSFSAAGAQRAAAEQQAARILKAADIKGGLIVHVGCADGRLTAALRVGEGYLVHGLDCDKKSIKRAREYVRSVGQYGEVAIASFDGEHLPYADNLVNLIVSEDLGDVPMAEVLRVLAPAGVAYIKTDGEWTKTVKARPKEIDEWTHFLYDSTNNAVSNDSVVGPPSQLQWVAGPAWARSHDHLASVSAVVSSGGRIFYIVDEGPIAAVLLEPRWYLEARDAFNGVLLWKRPIAKWQWHLRGFRSGPSDLARRLVAVGDRVYVTLGVNAAVTALDGATGRTVRTYDATEGALEIVHCDGTLFIVAANEDGRQSTPPALRIGQKHGFTPVVGQRPAYLEEPPSNRIIAVEADSGRVLWTKRDDETTELMPTTLAVSKGRAFFQDADEIICLNARTGQEFWRAARPTSRSRPTWSAPTLVVYEDVVLSGDRAVAPQKSVDEDKRRKVEWIVSSAGGQAPTGELIAFSVKDGTRLWGSPCRECYNAPVDVLVAGGLVWTGNIVRAKDPGVTAGRDPRTGQVKRTRPADRTFFVAGMGHQRCYRNKATNKYLVFGRSGIEFIDVATGNVTPNHWVRGACQYGVMPANGLVYAPPHSCACFITAKLNGFNCLVPSRASKSRRPAEPQTSAAGRLEQGPAYGKINGAEPSGKAGAEWPTYRCDSRRSGAIPTSVDIDAKQAWKRELGGRLSSVVVADGRLFVAQVDGHTVHALDARDGRVLWSHTVGGRVDSPPTIWRGRALFGCADGWVYCLRASDGTLTWRFRAAPQEQRIVVEGQIESLWPVHGSVLVQDGVLYCAAGRSSYLDGGIRLCRINAETGELLSETVIDDRDPQTGYQRKGVIRGTNMPGALPDVLSCDGDSIYMRHIRFDLAGKRQASEVPHLFSAAGFLDDTWWHRSYWLLGTAMGTNYGGWPRAGNQAPAGRLLVLDESSVYGFGRNQYIHHGAHVGIDGATIFHFRPDREADRRFTYYQAFAIGRKQDTGEPQAARQNRKQAGGQTKNYRWTKQLPVLARAAVLARDQLLLAGPPDIFSSDEPRAALDGKKGGLLCILSTGDGKTLRKRNLESPPVFDGMAVAGGDIYMSTMSGAVVCLR